MTLRQAGRRSAAVSSQRRSRSVRQPSVRHGGARRTAGRKEEPLSPRERRRLLQLMVCGGIFVLLVAAKLLLPDRMAEINGALSRAMEQNVDVQAVFSAVGRAFTGEDGPGGAFGDIYQAVFHPEQGVQAQETAVQSPASGSDAAMKTLRESLPEGDSEAVKDTGAGEAAQAENGQEQVSNLAYVMYSNQNLPENVSLEQAILNFDYCVPVNGTLSSDFGYREHPVEGEERFHYGVDLAADTGTEIVCFADGTVTAVGESSSYGKYCMVSHAGGCSTLYAHCSRITVSSGTAVKEGQKIAEVGETGIATGPHLHFELQKDGVYLNPIYYVS